MRDRDDAHQTSQAHEPQAPEPAPGTLTQLMVTQRLLPGKHRAPGTAPRIPAQTLPTHDEVAPALPLVAPDEVEVETADLVEVQAEVQAEVQPEIQPEIQAAPQPTIEVPHTARWRASHLPRTVAAATLLAATIGTVTLGARYAQTRAADDFVSLAIGLGVVVVLWAVVIATTPQVVTLDGSVLTVSNTSGSEDFDLADALQPIDVVGNPRTSHWAVLLHRLNSTTVVLRRNDVVAIELDPIVRHYRMVAEQRHLDRDARFNR